MVLISAIRICTFALSLAEPAEITEFFDFSLRSPKALNLKIYKLPKVRCKGFLNIPIHKPPASIAFARIKHALAVTVEPHRIAGGLGIKQRMLDNQGSVITCYAYQQLTTPI